MSIKDCGHHQDLICGCGSFPEQAPEAPREIMERLGLCGKRVTLIVHVNLDPIPGWGNTAEDYRALTQRLLDDAIGHYYPHVEVQS